MGVTTKKNIMPITIGATIFPRKIPNLNHNLFRGVKSLEFIKPKIKKIKDIQSDNVFISLKSPRNDQRAITKNTKKNTIPKFLLEPILILDLDKLIKK